MTTTWLNDSWSFYFHDPVDDNWSRNGYKKIFTFSTIPEFWMLFTELSKSIQYGMYFIMRDHIFPKWNDEENKDGGFLSIKILKEKMPAFCEHLLINLVNESLLKEEYREHSGIVNGVSLSPKKHFCIVKIWLKTSQFQSCEYFDIKNDYHGSILFKKNTCVD